MKVKRTQPEKGVTKGGSLFTIQDCHPDPFPFFGSSTDPGRF
jgi:hypothetical protein